MKVYGPYRNKKDDRDNVIIYYSKDRKETMSYARWLMEQHLGRLLTKDETVDHIDRNKHNHTITNLRVVASKKHLREDAKRVRLVEIICVRCKKKALKHGGDLHHNSKLGKAGPFCGKSCAGKYSQDIRMGSKKLDIQPLVPREKREYFFLDKYAGLTE